MKDIVITPMRIKKELIALLVIFFIGIGVNMLAITIYKGRWNEMFTSLPYVLLFTLVVYLLWSLIRIIAHSLKRLVKH